MEGDVKSTLLGSHAYNLDATKVFEIDLVLIAGFQAGYDALNSGASCSNENPSSVTRYRRPLSFPIPKIVCHDVDGPRRWDTRLLRILFESINASNRKR